MPTAEVFPPEHNPADRTPGSLEARLASLTEAVARLEARVASLESTSPQPKVPLETVLASTTAETTDLPNPVRTMGLIGRVCLILGGGTFIRSLVDAQTLPHGWGIALGLAYAATWALLALRAKQPLDAAFHALASILLTYPLIAESTVRFGILEPGLAAFLLLGATCLHGAVAWRRDLKGILWTTTMASLGSGLAMMAMVRSIEPFLSVFLVLGIATLWLTQGRWAGLRWPTALAADLAVLVLTALAAWSGGTPEIYRTITPGRSMGFALALVVLYVGSFAWRMLKQRSGPGAFEVAQTVLVFLVGFGGALRIALATGSGAGPLGVGSALAGLGCYAAAIPFAAEREGSRANFRYFSFLGLTFLLLGGPIALPLQVFATLACALGLVAMVAGLRQNRPVLVLQSSLYLFAGVVASGLAAWVLRAFLSPAGPSAVPTLGGILSLGGLVSSVLIFLLRRPSMALTTRVRPLILVLGAAATGGLGALVIQFCAGAFLAGAPNPGTLAAIRTGVLSALAILLAWGGRRAPALELRWLVYPLMTVTALKFLLEDLAVGRPLTLFLGFMCFGATLMLAPRLLKMPAAPDKGPDDLTPKPEVHP